jgi:hypothetical protein
MRLLEVAFARAGRGLDGDRYAAGAGTFSPRAEHRPGYDLTLIAGEVLDELSAAGRTVDFAATRRNVLTRASTSTPWSAAPSASATCSAKGAVYVSRAYTLTGSAVPACSAHSSTRAACAPTSSPTANFG